MVLHILRALFVLLMGAVGWFYVSRAQGFWDGWLTMATAVVVAVLLVSIDILSTRKKLAIFSGTFFGLIVGIAIAYALSFVVELLTEQIGRQMKMPVAQIEALQPFIIMIVGVSTCYLAISFILQTKDDFRFVIPYVEFSKQTKGARPIILDTSVLIDGRITDIVATGFLESQLIVPRFVLVELQSIADSAERLKRNRGRRGLDVLAQLQGNGRAEVIQYEATSHEVEGETEVDQKLMTLAKNLNARVLTNDFNLNKVAQLRGVDVININDLGNALKPVVLPGEKMNVRVQKAGEEPGQGVGYLEDGTMVVVEHGRQHVNEEVEFTVTSVLQTSAGRMIFGRIGDGGPAPPARRRGPARAATEQHREEDGQGDKVTKMSNE